MASLISWPLQRGELGDLGKRQRGEQFEKARDVAVLGVAPVLPVVVRANQIGIEPDRAGGGLAHLGARGGGDQRRGQREHLRAVHAAAEIDAGNDVAPLIGAAHLQRAAVALVEFDEIVGLQHHVIEFEERQFLLAVEPHLDRVEGEHAVDREVLADIAQEIDVVERVQPVGIVGHDGVAAVALEFQKLGKDRADADEVLVDHVLGENAAAFVLAGRVADAGGAAAHQRDRPVAGLLHPIEHHDRQQRADMQRGGGAVEADIGGDWRLRWRARPAHRAPRPGG